MTERRRLTSTGELERRKRNRRAFPRWLLEFEVRLTWNKESIVCRGCEISECGLSVLCERQLPREVEIDVQYRLGSQADPVNVKGAVRHVDGTRNGIEFLNLGVKDRLALVEFCEKLEPI